MNPGTVDFICPQGSTFTKTLTYSIDNDPVDLTGYSANLQIREFHYSPDYILSLSSATTGISLGGSAGTITLTIPASATTIINAGKYVYDLEITVGGTVSRLIEGKFTVTPEVTR